MVDIEGGKDLTILNINGVERMSVEDIAEYINSRVSTIKREEGGDKHKKAVGPLQSLPAFLIQYISTILFFISFKWRVNLPGLELDSNSMGTVGFSSVINFGFEDSTAPLNAPSHWTMVLTANAITRQPIV